LNLWRRSRPSDQPSPLRLFLRSNLPRPWNLFPHLNLWSQSRLFDLPIPLRLSNLWLQSHPWRLHCYQKKRL
jgi:hypothetical protein